MSGGPTREVTFGSRVRPGSVVADRYRVIELLGAGGMGQVLLVEHVELSKRFALKLIRPDRWDETLEARFRREARALARVNTPRVAQVTDFGVDAELGPFFVMEYVEGRTLGAIIDEEGRIETGRALELAIGIAEALRDVHAAGIVHRDVKPGNIAVGDGPIEVRLMDFGLAASLEQSAESRITQSRSVVGSMPYMAPEQFGGGAPSPAMDLWALGIVLYEMLHGRLPFEAQSTPALIHQILTQEVPLTPHVGPALSPVFARLLAKEPGDRARSAEEAIELLEEAAAAPPEQWESSPSSDTVEAVRIDTHRPPPMIARAEPQARTPWWALGAGVLVLVAGVGALSWQLGRQSDGLEARSIEPTASAAPEVAPVPEPAWAEAMDRGSDRASGSASELGTSGSHPGSPEGGAGTASGEGREAPRLPPGPSPTSGGGGARRSDPSAADRASEAARRRGRGRAIEEARAAAVDEPTEPAQAASSTDDEGEAWNGGIIESPSE